MSPITDTPFLPESLANSTILFTNEPKKREGFGLLVMFIFIIAFIVNSLKSYSGKCSSTSLLLSGLLSANTNMKIGNSITETINIE